LKKSVRAQIRTINPNPDSPESVVKNLETGFTQLKTDT
jgi:hypothetical protein